MPGRKEHWEKIYGQRRPDELSWFQAEATKSLELILASGIAKDASVIDVGAGASALVDGLLAQGFSRLSVLDISAAALAYARERLGEKSASVRWIEADITLFQPAGNFELWHDRAVFHFLVDAADREKYLAVLKKALKAGGTLILAAFAPDGPVSCSGLPVCRYDAKGMAAELGPEFKLLREEPEAHRTPSDTEQKFRYFLFRRG